MPPNRAFRIGDPNGRYPVFSAEGATLSVGRWHEESQEVIYASQHYSTALLDSLVYVNDRPVNQRYVEIEINPDISFEIVSPNDLNGWDAVNSSVARQFGSQWLQQARSALLLVPCVIAPLDYNVLLNPNHPDAPNGWQVSDEFKVHWDHRLFQPRFQFATNSQMYVST